MFFCSKILPILCAPGLEDFQATLFFFLRAAAGRMSLLDILWLVYW